MKNVYLTTDDGFGMLAFTVASPILQGQNFPCNEVELNERGSLHLYPANAVGKVTMVHRTVGEAKFTAKKDV